MDELAGKFAQLSSVDDTAEDPSQHRGDDSLVFLTDDKCLFPRSEYKTRSEGTSAFSMSEPDYWGTYFRSTTRGGNYDRIAAKFSKTYSNEDTNTPEKNKKTVTPTKAGTINSPWAYKEYKKIFTSEPVSPKKTDKNNDILLYDQLLQYKKSICGAVVEEFSKKKLQDQKINVYYENDYPCVMVHVPSFHERQKVKGETSSLYSIVIAYFTGITNYVAKSQNIPIELVNRASFGHNIPSVTETGTSFRINIGIVPNIYAAQVLVTALRLLNTHFLAPLLNKNSSFKLRMNQEELNIQNANIESYNKSKAKNKQVEQWISNDNLFDVLCKVGDSGNRKVSVQITRKTKYIDLLTDYVNEEMNDKDLAQLLDKKDLPQPLKEEDLAQLLDKKDLAQPLNEEDLAQLLYKKDLAQPLNEEDLSQLLDKKDLAQPLWKILKKLDYSPEKVILKVKKKDFKTELTKFYDKECQDITNDRQFWKIIECINLVFTKHNINILSESIKEKKIIGLYSKLEKANLDFIRNSSYQRSKNGYGSDSDCDCDFGTEGEGKFTVYSKKITVSTGMRAINLAQFLSIYLTGTTKAETKYMYYETGHAIKSVADILQSLNLGHSNSGQEQIRYIDLTHCANNEGPYSKVPELSAKSKEQVIVLDYTSATTERVREAINKLIKKVPVLLLVSSGLKNEQIGADINPYGTIRIITREENKVNGLYFALKAALGVKEALPKELHSIRKAYKEAGAVVTSAGIYKKGYNYRSKSEKAEDSTVGGLNFPDRFKKILDLFLNDLFEEELHNLTKIHHQDINEIVFWSRDKIKYLGSSKVKELVEAKNYYFSQIIEKYDEGHELDNSVIGDTNEDNISTCDVQDVNEVFDMYRQI